MHQNGVQIPLGGGDDVVAASGELLQVLLLHLVLCDQLGEALGSGISLLEDAMSLSGSERLASIDGDCQEKLSRDAGTRGGLTGLVVHVVGLLVPP
jgi:hypothetical protein